MSRCLQVEISPDCPLEALIGTPGLRGPVTLLDTSNSRYPGARWSIMAEAPRHVFVAKDGACLVDGSAATGDPLDILDGLHAARSFLEDLPGEWPWPGMVAALSYDLKDHLEPAVRGPQSSTPFPDIVAYAFDMWVVHDHVTGTRHLLGYNHDNREDFGAAFREFARRLETSEPAEQHPFRAVPTGLELSRDDYRGCLAQLHRGIVDGNWYQANFTRRFDMRLEGSPHDVYRRLRAVSPAPFSAYMEFGSQAILSASPERFLRIAGDQLETCPIKGTRPRLADPDEDSRMQRELLESVKDAAELTMIVDLCRNDLARICVPGSVAADGGVRLESHAGVHHLVATVAGCVKRPWSLGALLRATFPAGSITGAPKIAAMAALGRLEPAGRAFYTGSLMLLDASGNVDSNVLIRTLLCDHEHLSFQVGGGIVLDSDPDAEWQETRDKAASLLTALDLDQHSFEGLEPRSKGTT